MDDNLLSKQASKRSYRFDLLKTIAIIGVILYHSGNMENGYLGVEVFLVISGYFLMKNYLQKTDKGSFNTVQFIANRILRLWPLVLTVIFLCLLVGYFKMLPDDFENLGESAAASSIFANNILAAITTKNYWNLSNNFKPLMHLWYVGVLIQSYIILVSVFALCDKIGRKALKWVTAIIAVLSLVLYFTPFFSSGDKFYYIPFRIFELLTGAEICFIRTEKKIPQKIANVIFDVLLVSICVVMIFETPFTSCISLIVEVLLTSAAVFVITHSDEADNEVLRVISTIGTASFSIYVIHQPIMAFTRYCYTAELTGIVLLVDLILIAGLSAMCYFVFEKGIVEVIKQKGWIKSTIVCGASSALVIALGLLIYINAGVVRDVPELDVYKATAYRGMHAEYVDIPYSWDKDFSTEKIHILVIGDSMARDWCNILNESDRSDEFEISYVYGSKFDQDYISRANDADYIFYACIGDSTEKIPEILKAYGDNPNF